MVWNNFVIEKAVAAPVPPHIVGPMMLLDKPPWSDGYNDPLLLSPNATIADHVLPTATPLPSNITGPKTLLHKPP